MIDFKALKQTQLLQTTHQTIFKQITKQQQNSNWKTLILKDSSVRSIQIYLTASPCYTTNN